MKSRVLLQTRRRTPDPFLPDLTQTLAQPIDECAIVGREIVKEAIDRFDDDAPLSEAGDRAQRVQPCLHFDGNTHTQLRIVLDLLANPCACRRTAGTASTIRFD